MKHEARDLALMSRLVRSRDPIEVAAVGLKARKKLVRSIASNEDDSAAKVMGVGVVNNNGRREWLRSGTASKGS